MVAVPGTSILLLVSTFLVATQAVHKDFLDDEFYKKIMDEMDVEEEEARHLIGIEADGSLGSKCGLFNKCNTGFECFHTRCIPNRNCMKEQLEEFDASFDSEGYKQAMFQTTGVTEEEVIMAYKKSGGDELAFANSDTIQSLVIYMKENTEAFDPVSEIVNSCSGIVSGRRLKVEKTTVRTGDKIVDVDGTERRLQTTPSPSSAPTISDAPSISNAPSASPSISAAPSNQPSLSFAPTEPPSASPTIAPTGQTFIGIHLEGGLIFELSLTISWLNGDASENQFVRGCFGAGIQGGIEFSFYVAFTFDGVRDGWACASVLFDTDAGLGLNLGMGFGICFAGSESVYLEFTIGAGIGAGIGFNTCYTLTREPDNSLAPPELEAQAVPLPLEVARGRDVDGSSSDD